MSDSTNVLLIGGGGREHALATAIANSPRLGDFWVTHPGNPGLAALGRPVDVPVNIREIYRLQQFIEHKSINLIVIGPEQPLADGFADAIETANCKVFGPAKAAAQLEADKSWAKQLMRSAAIPTAESRTFTNAEAAIAYLESREEPLVIKAAGLAAGKGVFVPDTLEEGCEAIHRLMIQEEAGAAGSKIVIEERLEGPEVSVFALVDGRTISLLEPCRDHKRLGDDDTGPNTGGMGAICDSALLDDEMLTRITTEIIVPTIDALRRDGIEYRGVLYTGLMLTHAGPKVIEYNVRFGDPECQVLIARLETDLLEIMLACCEKRLGDIELSWKPGASCGVVLASPGYPQSPKKGLPIEGVSRAESRDDVTIYHAGTAMKGADLVTAGGRVLTVVATGDSLPDARSKAYDACADISFEGMQMRTDIGAAPVATTARRQS